MKKTIRYFLTIALLVSSASVLFAGGAKEVSAPTTRKDIRIGISPGPYGDMITQEIAPYLEKNGYTVSVVQFSDYVQPDLALNNGEIEANLMQHTVYLNQFSKDNNLSLSPVIVVPTAGAGVFSSRYTSLDQLKNGDQVAIPSDATNLARALGILARYGLITVKPDVEATKISLLDIASNPKNLQFKPLDAAQISRSLDSVAIGVVPGNFAIAAGMDFSKALAIEKLAENYKNVVVVRTVDLNAQLGQDLKAAVESPEFYDAITKEGSQFGSFDRPQWWVDTYGEGK